MQMRSEWEFLATGVIGAAIGGTVSPVFAFLLSKITILLSLPGQDINSGPLQGANMHAFLFLMFAVAVFVGYGGQKFSFELAGEFHTKHLRGNLFTAYLRQEIEYYDIKENTSGALTTRLAVDTRNVNEIITKTWGDVSQLLVTIVVDLVIAFVHSWALTLILLLMASSIIVSAAHESNIHNDFEDKTKKANAISGEVSGEAIRKVHTIAALNKQLYFEGRFFQTTQRTHKLTQRKAYLSSIGFSLVRSISFYIKVVSFYAGMRLIVNGSITFPQIFTTMAVIISSAENIGKNSIFASPIAKAKYSTLATFEVLDRQQRLILN